MNRKTCQKIASAIATGDNSKIRAALRAALKIARARFADTGDGAAWIREGEKFARFMDSGAPAFTVYAIGNSKLPFLSFSSLPGAGFCHGAGECLQFCYSFRAWRYPAAFFRQCQNAVLLQTESGRDTLSAELSRVLNRPKFRAQKTVDFRLYVDGDFTSAGDVAFWMAELQARPQLAAYGYSKAWHELLGYDALASVSPLAWPENYRLNLSSGSKHNDAMRAEMEKLPITRGQFIAVSIGRAVKTADHGTRAHNAELRAAHGKRGAFTCPGKCGECTPSGHACGSDKFAGVDIIIAAH